MGMRNQQRRAAKKKARDQRQRRRDEALAGTQRAVNPFAESQSTPEELIDQELRDATFALAAGHTDHVEQHLDALAVSDAQLVDTVISHACQDIIGQMWSRGWMPADLVRITRRRQGKRPAAFILEQIAAQLRGYAAATLDERWHAQLRTLGAAVYQGYDDHRLTAWGQRQKLDRTEAIREAIRALSVLVALPEIGFVAPPPGTAKATSARRASGAAIDERVLGRVRGLLAKAESTEFPEEAEALSAKAQELMARHSIDHALLAAGHDGPTAGSEQPYAVRVGVDAPYEQAKALLLQEVGAANRCRCVWATSLGFTTVVGFPTDVESVELLYTSLLVQATAAMVRGGSQRGRGGQSTTRSYRQSFLHAYAIRIGERLRGAAEEVSREAVTASGDDRLLPVLAARENVVQEAVDAMFPDLVTRGVQGGSNAAGWAAGTVAADLAALGARAEVVGGSARDQRKSTGRRTSA